MVLRKQRGGRNPFAKLDPLREKTRFFSIDGIMSLNILTVMILYIVFGIFSV